MTRVEAQVSFPGQKKQGAWGAHKASQCGADTPLRSAGCVTGRMCHSHGRSAEQDREGRGWGGTPPRATADASPTVHPATSSLPGSIHLLLLNTCYVTPEKQAVIFQLHCIIWSFLLFTDCCQHIFSVAISVPSQVNTVTRD